MSTANTLGVNSDITTNGMSFQFEVRAQDCEEPFIICRHGRHTSASGDKNLSRFLLVCTGAFHGLLLVVDSPPLVRAQ